MTIRQGSSSRIAFTLKDANDADVPAAAVQTLTLSLIDVISDTFINSRNAQDVKGVNGGALVDGGGTIVLAPADNPIVSSAIQEPHRAILRFTTSNEAGSGEITFVVVRVHA